MTVFVFREEASGLSRPIKVHRDMLLVELLEAPVRSKGGILIPETGRARQRCGIVLAVGPGAVTESGARAPMDAELGELVFFGEHAGREFSYQHPNLLLVQQIETDGGYPPGSFDVRTCHKGDGTPVRHLAEDICDVCAPKPEEPAPEPPQAGPEDEESRARILQMRRELLGQAGPEPLEADEERQN